MRYGSKIQLLRISPATSKISTEFPLNPKTLIWKILQKLKIDIILDENFKIPSITRTAYLSERTQITY